MTANNLKDFFPYITQILTLIVAAVAIVTSRLSSRDTVTGQWRQEIWKKRAEIYLKIVNMTDRQDPWTRPTPEGFQKIADANEGKVKFHAIDIDSDEWRDFTNEVETYSSDEVSKLFELWDSVLGTWTWAIAKAMLHIDPNSKAHQESREELDEVYQAIHKARRQLVNQENAYNLLP
jgi:hypothetical protein